MSPRPLAVLVHGFAQTGRCWGTVPATLRAAGFDVEAPDLPGHGSRPEPVGDLAATAASVRSRARGAQPGGSSPDPGPATYVGYSFGGRVCLRLAVDDPAAVRRLVLVGATAGLDDAGERAARRAADEALADDLERDGLEPFLDRWLALPLFAGLSPEAQYRSERLTNTAAGLAASLRRAGTGAQDPLWDRLEALAGVPVLLVSGEHDRKFGALAERLADGIGPSAQRLVVAGAGHTAHLEAPSAFLEGVLPWLART